MCQFILHIVLWYLFCINFHKNSLSVSVGADNVACIDSDANLVTLNNTLCASLGCDRQINVTAETDWPNQAIYYFSLLDAVSNPSTCLNTSVARSIISFLDVTDINISMWWWTWIVFQVQYYDMPRKEGDRIESPATLGRKCWAFAFLRQVWSEDGYGLKKRLQSAMKENGQQNSLRSMIVSYDEAVPMTMNLCDEVMANCFVNASYDPDRNGMYYLLII